MIRRFGLARLARSASLPRDFSTVGVADTDRNVGPVPTSTAKLES
ncbi:hypothetical protein [Elstera cyanobacteriorum]|nr:hypothetical protein [Elstera cyanobacteriorum]